MLGGIDWGSSTWDMLRQLKKMEVLPAWAAATDVLEKMIAS
jgi:hypothetical protein